MLPLWLTLAGLLLSAQTADNAKPSQAPPAGPARTFHVDAERGDDQHDGLTPATAWRSLEKVNHAALRPGDSVLFGRGGIWRGQLRPQSGAAAGQITYGAFGDGPKPQLLGSAAMDRPEDWQPAGDGVWATAPVRFDPISLKHDLSRLPWQMHHEADASCAMANLPPDADGPGGYRIECKHPGTAPNHIQLSVVGLSVTDGEDCLFTFRARASQPVTLSRVSLMKQGPPYSNYGTCELVPHAIGDAWNEYSVRFHGCQTANDGRITVYLGTALPAGATLFIKPQKLVVARCNQPIPLLADVGNIIFDHGAATGFKKWREADLRDDYDYFYDARTWQVKLRLRENPASRHRSIELALRKHIIDESGCGYVMYDNLDLRYGAAHGIGGAGMQHVTARGCDISYIGGGCQFIKPDGKPVRFGNGIEFWSDARDCLVEGCRIWEIYDAAVTNQGSGTNVQENITYRRNVIWNSEYSFELWNRGPESHARNIRFEHNTCVNAGSGWGHRQRPDRNGRHLMFWDNSSITQGVCVRYNIFCSATDSCLRLHGCDWTSELTMDFNCWCQPRGPLIQWKDQAIEADQAVAFLHGRKFDEHSIIGDPGFVDPSRNDYRLAPTSVARKLLDDGMPAGAP